MTTRGSRKPYAPEVNTIQRGTVTRIEPYGAFVQLQDYRARGLVHISQLASYKVEDVNDAVSIDDVVWVKVVEVTPETDEVTGKVRHKVRLSMKYASQDGQGVDLDPTNEEADAETSRRMQQRRDDGREGGRVRGGGAPPSALEQSLNSNIGMGVAIDPLAAMSSASAAMARDKKTGRLLLRGTDSEQPSQQPSSGPVLFNGYALVDDDEGELEQKTTPGNAFHDKEGAVSTGVTSVTSPIVPVKPLGRGRGSTLPAWMTKSDRGDDGPTATSGSGASPDRGPNGSLARSRSRSVSSSSASSHSRGRRGRRRRKPSRPQKETKRSSRYSTRVGEKRRHRSERRSDRQRSSGRKRERETDENDIISKRRHKTGSDRSGARRRRKRSRRRSRSRSGSGSYRSYDSDSSSANIDSDEEDIKFADVEEAKQLIAKLTR